MRRLGIGVVLLAAACGGKIAGGSVESETESVSFHPAVGAAGYGFAGGYGLKLTDASPDGATRTLNICLTDIKDGSYGVTGGGTWRGGNGVVPGCSWVHGTGGSEAELVETAGGVVTTFRAVSGVVSLAGSATRIEMPGSSFGSWGSVVGHVDLVLQDEADSFREIRVSADYVASVIIVG
jgi:hypothetical protein